MIANVCQLVRRQAIIWTNAGLLPIVPFATNLGEISVKVKSFSL